MLMVGMVLKSLFHFQPVCVYVFVLLEIKPHRSIQFEQRDTVMCMQTRIR